MSDEKEWTHVGFGIPGVEYTEGMGTHVYINGESLEAMRKREAAFEASASEVLTDLLETVIAGNLNINQLKEVLSVMIEEKRKASIIVAERG